MSLILLVLLAGIALGWLLNDLARGAGQPSAATPAPTSSPLTAAPTAVAIAPTIAPTDAPTALPTAEPTAPPPVPTDVPTAAPTLVPPTLEPTSTPTEAPTLVPPTPTLAPTAEPTVAPTSAPPDADGIVGYTGHVVAAGETLAAIAASGGSSADLIMSYNHLSGEPQAGRMLVVPQLAGTNSTLASAPLLVQRGATSKPWVALTLDAGGDSAPTPAILKTLRDHHVKITFFLTGKWIRDNPDLTREIVADGHEIGNHTFNHPDLRKLSDDAVRKELDDTEALLQTTAGATTRPFLRPPYGAYDKRVLGQLVGQGYLPIYWTFDSLDSVGEPKTADFLFERITAHLPPDQLAGAIILAHCGSQPTADALPRILDRFAELGFEVKKLSEVLGG